MEKYIIYCSLEQTKKALELGAPINVSSLVTGQYGEPHAEYITYFNPTAEQMIGWLVEDKRISVKAVCFSWCNENKPTWQVHAHNESTDFWDEVAFGHSESCKEATLAAIDAALDYLKKREE